MTVTDDITRQLRLYAHEEKRQVLMRFFKTGKGEYGEGDRFMGVMVPQIRKVARHYAGLSLNETDHLLQSEWHEVRECGLFMLVGKCKKRATKDAFDFYLAHTGRINNWDLVDASAPTIVGGYLLDKSREPLDKLAESPLLWENRIAMVATLQFIRHNDLDTTYHLAQKLMQHPHDLMQKATGWMLREAGKKDAERLYRFVEAHRTEMPRTMLRYAIERFDKTTRAHLMRKDDK